MRSCEASHERKNWLFVGSQLAGERAAVLMSLIESAKLNGHDPWAYLVGPAKFTQLRPGRTLTKESRLPGANGGVCSDLGPPNELETGLL